MIPIAIDLTGSGINTTDSNSVSTLAEYSKPLIGYLESLPDDEQVRENWIGILLQSLLLISKYFAIVYFAKFLDTSSCAGYFGWS